MLKLPTSKDLLLVGLGLVSNKSQKWTLRLSFPLRAANSTFPAGIRALPGLASLGHYANASRKARIGSVLVPIAHGRS